MNYSPHQLAFFAHQLSRRAAADSMDRMAGALLDAQVDLNPHQIDAAFLLPAIRFPRVPFSQMKWAWAKPLKRVWSLRSAGQNVVGGF
uniref:Uncharacterized protein n=1 Tax=mine drainage metagenome TaxID=410659 RepID=E6QQ35_9ZZZZ